MAKDNPEHAYSLYSVENIEIIGFIGKYFHRFRNIKALDDFINSTISFFLISPSFYKGYDAHSY